MNIALHGISIIFDDCWTFPHFSNLSSCHKNSQRTAVFNKIKVMGDEDYRFVLPEKLFHFLLRLLPKFLIAHRHIFIEYQNFRFSMYGNRETKTKGHTVRVGIKWSIDKRANIRKIDNARYFISNFIF